MTVENTPKRRHLLWPVLLAAAVTAVLAGGAALTYVIGWGLADNKAAPTAPATQNVATQMECDSIKRAFNMWDGELYDLDALPVMKELPELAIEGAVEAGRKFMDATEGYPDQASKDLALSIAEYNVKVSTLNLEVTASGAYRQETYTEALTAREKVVTTFSVFTENTCS